ncbi:putative glycosidase CRH2 [Basidiobolus ranarum]|uniref:Glycosidase CRH2 n=1 Tax=Basidiobolus ranarum TaxID=34480 RepID=A0ABR2WRK9_9FUNG
MAIKKLYFFTFLAAISCQVYAGCKNYGGKCPQEAPCCTEGWCGTSGFCLATKCDPANSFSPTSCLPKPLCVSFNDNFDSDKIVPALTFDGNPNSGYDWTSDFSPNHATVENGQLVLNMPLGTNKNEFGDVQGFGATVSSVRWIQYGKVSARVKSASTSPGVVTAFILRNPEGDEIDFEWVGGNPHQVQTNYYYNGIIDWENGGKHNIGSDTSKGFHDYMFDWDEEYIKFSVDNKVVRTLYKKDTWDEKLKVYKFPSRLALVQVGLWDGGRGSEGTTDWAGGKTDWSNPDTVYKAYFDHINVECKYGGNETQVWPTSTTSVVTPTTTSVSSSTETSLVEEIKTSEQGTSSSTASDSNPTGSFVAEESSATSHRAHSALAGIACLIAGYFLG